jgi:hypothetical protein
VVGGDGDLAAGAYEPAPDRVRGHLLVAGEALAEVVGGGPGGQGGIEVDVERDRRAERVEVEAADLLGEALLDPHPFRVPADDLFRRALAVVGEDQCRVLVPESPDRDLAQRDWAAAHGDVLLVDLRLVVGTAPVKGDRCLPGLLSLGARRVGVEQVSGLGVLHEERQDRLGPLRAPWNVVILERDIVAEVHDRVEVQIEIGAAGLSRVGHRGRQGGQQLLVVGAGQAVAVAPQAAGFRQRLEPREHGERRIDTHVIDMADATPSDRFQREE